jgi:hypothetical protein
MPQCNIRRWARPRPEKRFPLFDTPGRSLSTSSPEQRSQAQASTGAELPPHRRAVATSIEAARRVQPHTRGQRQILLAAIAARGSQGATLDELVVETGIPANVVSPRLGELRKAELIVDSGDSRMTRANCPARIWILNSNLAASRFAADEGKPTAEQIQPIGLQVELPGMPEVLAAGTSDSGSANRAAPRSQHDGACHRDSGRPPDFLLPPNSKGNSHGGDGCQISPG